MFCRSNECPKEFFDELDEICETAGIRFKQFELAPPDAKSAVQIVGGQSAFERVRGLVAENKLRCVGSYPAALQALSRVAPNARVTEREVWELVLRNLLRERSEDQSGVEYDLDKAYNAACRIGAVMALSGLREISRGQESIGLPSVREFFPDETPEYESRQRAADYAQRLLMVPRGEGSEFREEHVQEWLAALALADTSLERLQPILSKDGKPIQRYQGVMFLLHRISRRDEVRDWIKELHGGVPPARGPIVRTRFPLKRAGRGGMCLRAAVRGFDYG